MAEAMVLAVYMPPQEPGPGMAQASISASSAPPMWPRARAPTASNTETMSTRRPWWRPGAMVPP